MESEYVFIMILLVSLSVTEVTSIYLPEFKYVSYKATIPETFTKGEALELHPTATIPGGGVLVYSITHGNVGGQFTIDSQTGVITNSKTLDREEHASYVLMLRAEVKDDPSKSATATMTVVVSDVNDNAPQCVPHKNESVKSVLPPGQVVLSLNCEDMDEGKNAELAYEIAHSGYLPFNVSQYGNVLVSTYMVYRDDGGMTGGLNTYSFDVFVKNTAFPFRSTSVKVTITIIKSECPTVWKWRRLVDHTLTSNVLRTTSALSESTCTQQCEDETSFSCNSVNWVPSSCEMLTETDSTGAANVEQKEGSLILIKYCIAEPDPSPFLRDIQEVIPVGSGPIPVSKTYPLLEALRRYTQGPDDQTHTDVWVVTQILQTLADRTDIPILYTNISSLLESVSATVSNLLQDMYVGHWGRLNQKGNQSSAILLSMETMTSSLATKLTSDLNVSTERVEVLAVQLDPVLDQEKQLELSPGVGPPTSVNLPTDVLHQGRGSVSVVVSVFQDMDRITNVSDNVPSTSPSTGQSERALVGDVVSVVVYPDVVNNFTKPVVMEIESLPNENVQILSRECVFLDKTDVRDEWRSDGCETTFSNTTHTRCECYHLTNFAVLMQIVHVKMTGTVELSLEVLTIIGCVVSILSLTATIVTNIWLKMNSERVVLLINLSASLILAQIVFMAGAGATQNPSSCRVIAALLHYLYLTVFSLMLVEGLQLYMRLYLAFNKDGKVVIFIVSGWSLPFILVGISVGVDPEGYGTSYSCWLSTERGTIWAFVGPVLIIGVVNLFVLGMVIKTFLSLKINARKTDRQKFLSSLKAASVLLPLLGITWTFGVLAINSSTVAFQYLFALLNSTQGLFIFLFHVVCNDEIRVAYWKKRGRILTVNSATHSNSTVVTSTYQARRKNHKGRCRSRLIIVMVNITMTDMALQYSAIVGFCWFNGFYSHLIARHFPGIQL